MASPQSKKPPPPPSKLRRALTSLPFLLLAMFGGYLMDIPSLMRAPPPFQNGKMSFRDTSVTIPERFHLLPIFDNIFRDITHGFAPATFEIDGVSWWQSFVFLTDAGVVFLIWWMESSRAMMKGTLVYYPVVLVTIAQLGGGGVFMPLYYFLYLIFSPPAASQSIQNRKIDLNDAMFYLPLTLLLSTIPIMGMYLAPSMQDRHWWTWLWQLFPMRITIGYYILKAIRGVIGWPNVRRNADYHATLRMFMGPIIAVSTALWIYTLSQSPYPLSTVFLPTSSLSDFDNVFAGLMRKVLQYDQLFVFGASFLWLGYLMWEEKGAKTAIISRFVALLGLVPIVGPGATLGVMWLVRERYLVSESRGSGKVE